MTPKLDRALHRKRITDYLVKSGLAERDPNSPSDIRPLAHGTWKAIQAQILTTVLSAGPDTAITYGMLLFNSSLSQRFLDQALLDLVRAGVLEFACKKDGPRLLCIFYLKGEDPLSIVATEREDMSCYLDPELMRLSELFRKEGGAQAES